MKLALVVIIFFAFMLSLWLFEWPQFGDPETQVDAPAEIRFDIAFRQSELDDIPSTEWPDFRLIIAPEDAEALGSLTEIPFEWNPNGGPRTESILVTENHWQDTEEQVIDWPCFQGPIYVAAANQQVVAFEQGHCPSRSSTALERIDTERVLALLPPVEDS